MTKAELIQSIEGGIYQNNERKITGNILQATLKDIVADCYGEAIKYVGSTGDAIKILVDVDEIKAILLEGSVGLEHLKKSLQDRLDDIEDNITVLEDDFSEIQDSVYKFCVQVPAHGSIDIKDHIHSLVCNIEYSAIDTVAGVFQSGTLKRAGNDSFFHINEVNNLNNPTLFVFNDNIFVNNTGNKVKLSGIVSHLDFECE